jgi:hypothetical protein
MGLFDYVRSSYPLGEAFTGPLQTKDIEPCCGGSMSDYWISPNGQLFYMDYTCTSEFYEDEDATQPLFRFRTRPTGEKGRVRPERLTKSVNVYPANYKGSWEDWPKATLFFVDGVITGVYETHRAL